MLGDQNLLNVFVSQKANKKNCFINVKQLKTRKKDEPSGMVKT